MTKAEYDALVSWFAAYADGFRNGGVLPQPLELKRQHGLRTADNAALIAEGLGRDEGQTLLARAAALLHDAGRFNQFARFGSFRDADTLDHGEEGWLVLRGKMPALLSDNDETLRLLTAVRYHNRRNEDIPAGLEPGAGGLLKLVRDADKLDILEIVLGSVERDGFKELPSMLPNIRLGREITPRVLEKALRRQSQPASRLGTVADFLLSVSVWFFELNYAPSRRLAAARGLPARLRRELPGGAELDRFFSEMEAALAQ